MFFAHGVNSNEFAREENENEELKSSVFRDGALVLTLMFLWLSFQSNLSVNFETTFFLVYWIL